jgi:hypothetical protein
MLPLSWQQRNAATWSMGQNKFSAKEENLMKIRTGGWPMDECVMGMGLTGTACFFPFYYS